MRAVVEEVMFFVEDTKPVGWPCRRMRHDDAIAPRPKEREQFYTWKRKQRAARAARRRSG